MCSILLRIQEQREQEVDEERFSSLKRERIDFLEISGSFSHERIGRVWVFLLSALVLFRERVKIIIFLRLLSFFSRSLVFISFFCK